MADVDSLVGDRLALMDLEYRRNRHELVELSLERAIRDRVLEKEAAARGLTLEEFVSQLSEGRVEVTEEDVVNFYRRNMGAFGGRRLEDMHDQIVEYLEDRGHEQILDETMTELSDSVTSPVSDSISASPISARVPSGVVGVAGSTVPQCGHSPLSTLTSR